MESHGNLPCLAQSEDSRFVLLHGAGGDAGDVFRVQAEFGKIPFRDEAQLLRLDAAAAAHAEDEGTAGDIKVQHLFRKRVFAIPEDGMAACDILRVLEEGNLPGGGEMALEDSTGSAEGYGASVEQGGVEGADGFRVEDACVLLSGGFVKGGEAVDVRGGADYGLSAGDAGYAPGQPVGASEMPGGKGNHMAAAFRTGKHGGVNALVAQQWGGFAEGDPRRADEDMRVELRPVGGEAAVEVLGRYVHDAFRVGWARTVEHRGQAQPGGDLPGSRQPLVREGVQGAASVEILRNQTVPVAMREVGVVEPRGCAVGSQGPAHDDERLPSEPGFLGLPGDVAHRAAQDALIRP